MEKYAIGLDIGITSVGWATVLLDETDSPCGILDLGSRIFEAAEHPKTGASLAAPRREARSARRRLRRHRHRLERIRALMVQTGLLTEEELATLFDGKLEDIYALRTRALDVAVTRQEFARILIHLAQRRGFRSNRKAEADGDDGKLLQAVNENKARMEASGYRTVGEMLLRDPAFTAHKRNKGGEYVATVARDLTEAEARNIFAAQRARGVAHTDEAFEDKYVEILLGQRSFDDGPGGDSRYGGAQIWNRVGKCTLLPEEKRAAKASYSFEYFSLLEKINHIRIQQNGDSLPLTQEQREKIIALAHESDSVTYARIRKALALADDATFNMVYYRDGDIATTEKKAKFAHLQAYHKMRKAFDKIEKDYIGTLSAEKRNELAKVLSVYKTDKNIETALADFGFTPAEIEVAKNLSFSKFGHLSVKACNLLIPYLEQGMRYNEACAAAGLNFRAHEDGERSMFLHPTEDTYADVTSPVVRRAISQTIKVVNAIIRKQGTSPTFINIELAREMAKDFAERNKIKKENESNRAQNERIMERIRTEYGVSSPTGLDLVKLQLFEQQGGVCAYSLTQMSAERLFEPNYAEIDHIVPYSISFDDSRKNKVLVLAKENRDKGNRLPLQYLTGKRRDDFIVWVSSHVQDPRKRSLLLKERITDEDEKSFKERNLQDTKTMARFLLNYLQDNLAFTPFATGRKKHVTAVNGIITSYMRKRLGISKIRENGDLHHAVDALTIACTTDGMIQQISRHAAYRECEYTQTEDGSLLVDPRTGEVLKKFPYPWPRFRDELNARLSDDPEQVLRDLHLPLYASGAIPYPKHPVFVSRMPNHKVTGAAHKDTVKSPRTLESGQVIVKKALTDLSLKALEEDYYNKDSDRLLYDALVERLKAFKGDAKKAFATDFHKPKSDGTPGPVVKKVKLLEKTTLSVPLHGGKGVADNDSMVRIDIFYVEGDGYYLVPIYVADTLKETLPNRACVAGKPYAEWKEMRDEDFLFSLYPNDLIRVTHKKLLSFAKSQKEATIPEKYETKSELVYYNSTGISTASVKCFTHDNSYMISNLGIKTLENIEKFTVDVLGNYAKVEKEKRIPFTMKRG